MGIRRQDALDGKRARATIRQFSTELCWTNSAKSVLLWRTMPSIAHFYSSPTISPSQNDFPQVASYLSPAIRLQSHLSGWQSLAFQRAHTSHLYPQDTLCVGRISMLEVRNSNQWLKSICHSVTKILSCHLWSCHTGWICQRDISPVSFFVHLHGFLHACTPMCTHTHREREDWLILLSDKY